jgi:hypothetical protein
MIIGHRSKSRKSRENAFVLNRIYSILVHGPILSKLYKKIFSFQEAIMMKRDSGTAKLNDGMT